MTKKLDHRKLSANTSEEIIKLDIPDLPEDQCLMQWQIPTTQSYEWIDYAQASQLERKGIAVDSGISSDEGGGIVSHKNLSITRPIDNIDKLWEQTLQYKLSEYTNWDMKKK